MEAPDSPYLAILRDRIDIERVPFSDRGSRLLVYKLPGRDLLYVKLAERLTRVQPGVETYLTRPPFIEDLCFVDESGRPLPFQLTTYPHVLSFRSGLGTFGLTFQESGTLAIGLPANLRAGVRFRVRTQMWSSDARGGSLKGVRDLAYRTSGPLAVNRLTPEADGSTLELIAEAGQEVTIHLTVGVEHDREGEIVPFSRALRAAAGRWGGWFARVPPVLDRYQAQYAYAWWVIGNNLVTPLGHVRYEAMMPSKAQYVGIWNWDSCFHALALRHADPELARNQLRNLVTWQLPDGMIPDAIYDDGVVDRIDHPVEGAVTKPPVIAWAALKLHETDPDLGFLRELYHPLVRWNAWWFSENDDDADGLAQYTHPYSSGLDDSPLFDHGLPVEAPDLNTYLCIQMRALGVIAEALGMRDEAEMWRRRASAIVKRMIQDFYDREAGLFWATCDHKPIPEVTLFNLYPLWTGQLPSEIQERLITHLTNPDEFWAPYPLATVARNSKSYAPGTMWRGPTWANVNYIFIEALDRVGRHDLAKELRHRTLDLLANNHGLHEFYHPERGEPAERAVPMFGWTAAVYVDLALRASAEQSDRDGLTRGVG